MIRSILFCWVLLCSLSAAAQPCVDVSKTPEGRKMLVGLITRSMIIRDTAFHEFEENGKWFVPQPADVDALKVKVDSVHFIVIFLQLQSQRGVTSFDCGSGLLNDADCNAIHILNDLF